MSIPEMDMNPEIARKLLEVGEEFRIEGPFFSYEEIKMGNVNHTYKVNYIRDDGTGMAKIKSFLVQRVNTYAFQHPIELMQNIDRVTEHIRENLLSQSKYDLKVPVESCAKDMKYIVVHNTANDASAANEVAYT